MPRLRLSLSSVRVRLTLWNVGVLAFALTVSGLVFIFSMRTVVSHAVDRQLSERAAHTQRRFAAQAFHNYVSFAPPFQSDPASSAAGPFGELRPRLFRKDGTSLNPADRAWSLSTLEKALNGSQSYITVNDGADAVRVYSVPLRRNGMIIGAAQVGNSLTSIRQNQARMERTLLTLIPLVLLIAGVGGAFLTDRALRPVRQVTQMAARIEAENLSRRLPVTGGDELAELADTFNGMLARLQSAFERQEEAFDQQRRFTADASHELRTPLTIIKANTSLALSGQRSAADLTKTLQTVDTAADRMNRIIQDLLLLARSDIGQLAYQIVPTDLEDVLTVALAGMQDPEYAPVTVSHSASRIQVLGNEDALVRLFSNLLENAARHTPTEGQITVTSEIRDGSVLVSVIDTGEGIAPEHLPHVKDRFYRVEAARSRVRGGTGLGLAICQSIVEAHSGDLVIESEVGWGTTVRVTLPLAPEPALVGDPEPRVLLPR